jgi:hypothetical protein
MATFVLVNGAWHGAWCWRLVVRLLTHSGQGLRADAQGVCERSHLLTPGVDLDTHILDIVNELRPRVSLSGRLQMPRGHR